MTNRQTSLQAELHLAGTFECRAADGTVLKQLHISGVIPLGDQAQHAPQDDTQQEPAHGADNR